MTRLLAKTLGLFILGIFTGSFIITPPLAVDTKTEAVTQIQSAYPYLSAVSESQIAIPDTTKVIASEATIDARFVGVLSHVKWLIRGTTIPSRHSDDSEIVRIDKQIYSFMDDVSEDLSDLRDDIGDGGLPEAFTVDDSGIVTAGTWQGTAITDLYIADILTIGSGSTFANNLITPNGLLTTGQTDEYCLTYEATGSTWEWQVCGAGGGLTTNDIDTSAELLTIVGDETGSGNLVFSTSPTFTGTVNAAAATLSSTLTLSGSAANIALGSNYLSGDGGDEGIYVDANGNIGIGTTTPNGKLTITGNEDTALLAFGDTTNSDQVNFYTGATSPEGRVSAPIGSLFIDSQGGTLYQKTSDDNGSTGWGVFSSGTSTHAAKMAVSTATSVLHATEVLAGFDTVVFDQGGITDVAQKRFVIKRAGKYLVSAFWTAKNLDIGESAEAIVYKNGSTQVLIAKTHSATTNQRVTAGGAQVVELQAGDYLTMVIQQFEGATQVSSTNEGERIEMSVTEVGRVQNTGGSSLFTDGGSNSYLTDTADNLLIGTTTNSVNAKFVLRQQNAFDIINIFDGSTEVFSILDGGNVGIGTTSPYAKLSVNGNIALTGGIYDSGASLGTNGMVLLSTGTGVDWVATSSLGITGGGGLTTSDIDTSSELAAILGDETGTAGAVVFSTSPTFTGTVNAAAATLSSTLTLSGSAANIALGSNYLSGDGGDEGIYVDATGRIGIGTTTPYRALELHSAVSGSAVVRLDEPNPRYEWRESDASSNNKLWRAEANGSVWSIAVQNDALTQTNPVLSIGRSGSTPGNIYTADVRLGLNDSTPDFRLEATGTVGSGYFGVTNSTDGDIFIINGSGNVGIGTTTPSQKLQVFGNIRVGTSGSNGCLEDFGGGLIAGTCSSDENLKENIVPIAEDGRSYLESLTALTPVTYNWNEEASELYSKDVTVENLGLIAQDVEEQFPELVTLNDEGYHQVDFRAFPFYIIEAIKELWIKVQGHDERLGELEDENEYLRERIETIENELNVNTSPPPDLEPVLEEGPIDPEGDAPSDEPDPVEPEVPLVPEASE